MKNAPLAQKQEKLKTTVLYLKGNEFAPRIYDLHVTAHTELTQEKKHHLLLKDMSYFESALDDPMKFCIVSFAEGKMAGMTILSQFDTYKEALTKKAVTFDDPTGKLSQETANGKIWTIQSLCRLNKYKAYSAGQDILTQAVKIIQDFPTTEINHLFAQSSDDNKPSLKLFETEGFTSKAQWKTDHLRHIFHKIVLKNPAP